MGCKRWDKNHGLRWDKQSLRSSQQQRDLRHEIATARGLLGEIVDTHSTEITERYSATVKETPSSATPPTDGTLDFDLSDACEEWPSVAESATGWDFVSCGSCSSDGCSSDSWVDVSTSSRWAAVASNGAWPPMVATTTRAGRRPVIERTLKAISENAEAEAAWWEHEDAKLTRANAVAQSQARREQVRRCVEQDAAAEARGMCQHGRENDRLRNHPATRTLYAGLVRKAKSRLIEATPLGDRPFFGSRRRRRSRKQSAQARRVEQKPRGPKAALRKAALKARRETRRAKQRQVFGRRMLGAQEFTRRSWLASHGWGHGMPYQSRSTRSIGHVYPDANALRCITLRQERNAAERRRAKLRKCRAHPNAVLYATSRLTKYERGKAEHDAWLLATRPQRVAWNRPSDFVVGEKRDDGGAALSAPALAEQLEAERRRGGGAAALAALAAPTPAPAEQLEEERRRDGGPAALAAPALAEQLEEQAALEAPAASGAGGSAAAARLEAEREATAEREVWTGEVVGLSYA